MPADVTKDAVVAEVRAAWGDDVDRLDAFALDAYASQVATLRSAQARVEAEGMVIAGPKGDPIPHPCIAIAKAAQVEVRQWGSQFQPKRSRR